MYVGVGLVSTLTIIDRASFIMHLVIDSTNDA
jgi:hypothetical protein